MGEKRAEIYTYEAPWQIYAMNWSVRFAARASADVPTWNMQTLNRPAPPANAGLGRIGPAVAMVVCWWLFAPCCQGRSAAGRLSGARGSEH